MNQGRLSELRARIDALDEQLLDLINARGRLAMDVAEVKRANGDAQFYRPEREAQVLRRIAELNRGPLANEVVARLFREIISACLALEQPLTVAYLGPEGTFTQLAALKHFGQFIRTVPVAGVELVFRAVEAGSCDYGVVPIENSIEGVVAHTLDTFTESPLQICGEVELPIHHNLLSRAGELAAVREVFAHPQALAQCRRWLDENLAGVARTPVTSNAEGARRAAGEPGAAAIASTVAGEIYQLPVLAQNIETLTNNTTRFLVIGRRSPGPSGQDKTTLVFSIPNQPGALHRVLASFEHNGINMARIESRPLKQGKWAYSFFVDIDGHAEEPQVVRALAELEQQVSNYRLLGSYPRAAL